MRARKLGTMVLIAVGAALGLWLFAAVLLPLLLPLFIGLAVAELAKKPVGVLQKKSGLPRGLCSFVCVLGFTQCSARAHFCCAGFCAVRSAGSCTSCRSWLGGSKNRRRRCRRGCMPSRTNSRTASAPGFARG